MLWEPAIYEHKAALIGKSPFETANSASLLAEAVIKEYEIYNSDFLTVGIDVYNLEAEACGAILTVPGKNECPDILAPLFKLEELPSELELPDIGTAGRFALLLETGKKVKNKLGKLSRIRVPASGPVSIAVKLAGLDGFIISLALEDGNAARLLEFAGSLALEWLAAIRKAGLEAIIFDSFAAPPILSPEIYERHILPLHLKLMEALKASGQDERPLIIGGNTVPMAALLKKSSASMLVCDFPANAEAFASAIEDDGNISIRRNINPSLLSASPQELEKIAENYCSELLLFKKPVAGTAILPYSFNPEEFLAFRRQVSPLLCWRGSV